MYQAGIPARKFKTYDTSELIAEKQREMGLDDDKLPDQEKMGLDDKALEVSHVEDLRAQSLV
jgi:hypothetical protein